MGYGFSWNDCSHVPLTKTAAFSYCFSLSGIFVGSLYVLSPRKIRQLPRDDARQIKWRTFATSIVCIGSVTLHSFIFCTPLGSFQLLPALSKVPRETRAIIVVLTHTAILYAGPILQMSLEVYHALRRDNSFSCLNYIQATYNAYLQPIFNSFFSPSSSSDRWVRLRNLIIAPMAEEIVFRVCMVPALCATGMRTLHVVMIAPIFFGVAHAHHAFVRITQNEEKPTAVLIQTLFQFTYTSLFGSYVSYVYIQTRSLLAIVLSHSLCNGMGLPSLSFLSTRSPLFPNRRLLLLAHIVGVVGFAMGFGSLRLIPKSGFL